MLACWFGLHDYRPIPGGEHGERWIAQCANCPKRSEGLDVARKVKAATRPTTRQGRYQLAKLRERFGMTTARRKRA